MPALDTNVLVRYIVLDDAAQLAAARRLISRILAEGSTLFVPVTVVLELEWVLRSSYGFDKDADTSTFDCLIPISLPSDPLGMGRPQSKDSGPESLRL
jgi:predicted nucleic-acid-binding protein